MAVEVWWSSLAAADHHLLALLDVSERARVESLERPADGARSMLGAALLRIAVAAHLGIGPAQVAVDRTCAECGQPHGAPRIVRPGGPVPWVSASHSGVLVVVALSPYGPVGVDVQRESDLPDRRLAREWVHGEALLKAQTGASARPRRGTGATAAQATAVTTGAEGGVAPVAECDWVTTELRPPLGGYAAALTVLREHAGEVLHRHWPGAATTPLTDPSRS